MPKLARPKVWESDNPTYLHKLLRRDLRKLSKHVTPERLHGLLRTCRDATATPEARAEAREQLILDFMPFVVNIAGSFRQTESGREVLMDKTEAIGEGSLILIKTIDRLIRNFDSDSTPKDLAVFQYIRKALVHDLTDAKDKLLHPVTMPAERHKQIKRIRRAQSDLQQQGVSTDASSVAASSGLTETKVMRCSALDTRPAVRFDDVVFNTEREPLTYADVLPDERVETPEKLYATAEGRKVLRKLLQSYLPDKSFEVIIRVIGLDCDPMTHQEISKELKCSYLASKMRATAGYDILRRIPHFKDFLLTVVSPERIYGRHRIVTVPVAQLNPTLRHDKPEAKVVRKLEPEQVSEIRKRLAAGERNKDVAKAFGISPATVSEIRLRRKWKDVK